MDFDLKAITRPDSNYDALLMILFDELTRANQDDLLKRQSADGWPNIMRSTRLIPAVELYSG